VISQRYARLLLALGQWLQRTHDLESLSTEAAIALSEPLDAFAASTLRQLHARLVKRARAVDRTSAESLHELRKFARRVRYASEFLKPYQRPDEARRYVKLLTGVQDELGRTNDAVVAGKLLGELAGKEESIRDSAMFASGFLACGARLRMDKLDDRLQKLAQTRRPRRATHQ
jgi:CHAD domain-containing protein